MSFYSFRVTGHAADVTTFANLLLAIAKDGRVDLTLIAQLASILAPSGKFQPMHTTRELNSLLEQFAPMPSAGSQGYGMLVLSDLHDWCAKPEFRDIDDELGFFWFGSCSDDLVATFEDISECFDELTFLTCSEFVPQLVPGPGVVGFRGGNATFL
jgi:hypothetical protein